MLRDVSIKALLVMGFLVAGLLPLMIFALMSYTVSRNILKDQAFQQFESIRNIKIHQLEHFFNETKSQVRVLARNPQVRQFFRDMKQWRQQNVGAEKQTPLSGLTHGKFEADSRYRAIHDQYIDYFKYFVKQYGFYDLFLIEPEDGMVAFSVIKEPDFGTILSRTRSPLCDAWKLARSSDHIVLTDTRLYQPSNNVPAQFAVVRVKEGENTVGYLAVQISMDSIDRIMGERSGMGKTGETYLVGQDHLMRSDSYLDPKGHSILASLSGSLKNNGVDTVASQKALRGETGAEIVTDYNGNRVLSAYGPVKLGTFSWALMAEIDEQEIDQRIAEALNSRILIIMLLSIALLLSLAFLISAFLSRGISRVTSETENLVDKILKGKLHARGDPDKVGTDFRRVVARTNQLIDAFVNQINERRKMEEVMEYNQRMESIGTLAGGIAHDFNNILTYMFTYSDIIIGELVQGTIEHESMLEIQKAIHRATDLVGQIMTFSRQARQEKKPIQISLILKEAVKLLKATLPKSISVRKEIETIDIYVMAEPSQLYQIAMNLCTNAFHAMQETGGVLTVQLKLETGTGNENKAACILSIEDTGVGMDSETQRRIFEPYFTTKPVGEGSGMGLAVVHGIVSSLKGTIDVHSIPGKGTIVTVVLPTMMPQRGAEISETNEKPHTGTGRILFVDDEENIGKSTGQLLSSWGYSVYVEQDSRKADHRLKEKPTADDLLITDLNMPHINGIQLIENMRKRGDLRPVILLSGYSEMLNDAKTKTLPRTTIMSKPYSSEQMARVLDDVLKDRQ